MSDSCPRPVSKPSWWVGWEALIGASPAHRDLISRIATSFLFFDSPGTGGVIPPVSFAFATTIYLSRTSAGPTSQERDQVKAGARARRARTRARASTATDTCCAVDLAQSTPSSPRSQVRGWSPRGVPRPPSVSQPMSAAVLAFDSILREYLRCRALVDTIHIKRLLKDLLSNSKK